LDLLKPEYNILRTAGSSLGHKRSVETKAKIAVARRGCKHSEKTKNKIAAGLLGRQHTEESIAKMTGQKTLRRNYS
jgi:hypothetical protein